MASQQEGKKFSYAFQDSPEPETIAVLGQVPGRWGRMPPLCRAVVVEAGRALRDAGLVAEKRSLAAKGKNVGLIGASRRGSLTTDLDFSATMASKPALASPALFGYTLANIALAEAASHFGLIGPVYAVFAKENPLALAEQEAERLLATDKNLSLMLACEFDHFDHDGQMKLFVTFTTVY
ncbi:MAG: beta-ketoacyl synthase N-terminal-like domain-containing protein [Thermodesulfobacteriota bacterium]